MSADTAERVASILKSYSSSNPAATAKALRKLWVEFAPNTGMALIKAAQRAQIEAIGIPVPVLRAIGSEIAATARKDVRGFLPLAQLLWNEYGREGRVVALIVFGAMELIEPEHMIPLLKEACKNCVTWEDADRLALDALEPAIRRHPEKWLPELSAWLKDKNKWVRRASITVIGRLPMKHPDYSGRCLDYSERLLFDTDLDVKRAVSFAIRLCAKADPKLTCVFLKKQLPAQNPLAVWVLCDVIKSMDRKIVATFLPLLPLYEKWSAGPELAGGDRHSLESAMKVLRAA
jgi:3-methyladenine DNA glycosylase AlkD